MDLEEKVKKETAINTSNREELIKLRVKNSQLDSQNKMLDVEQQ
jgi:hypothetical protein